MSNGGRTIVVVATYNERENLPLLVDGVLSALPEADLLVVDDNSPDGTGRWCDERAASEPRLRSLHRAGKLGLGTAVIEGLRYAVDRGYECAINMDADLSHDPASLPALEAGIRNPSAGAVAVMIGSRYVAGGSIEGWPLRRKWMSRAVNALARRLLRLDVRDTSGSFRAYRVSALARLDWDAFVSRGYSFFEEVLWRLRRAGCTFGETPIRFVDRRRGKSKINLREAARALGVLVQLGREERRG
jgi:dolichol-phosphate mannosyltransferase